MKQIKRKLFIAAIGILLFQSAIYADNEHPIRFNQLPPNAKVIIENDFSNQEVKYAEMEKDGRKVTYEVKLSNGTTIEFDKNGNWQEIDCKKHAVPQQFIPREIANYVHHEWPNSFIVKIERSRKQFEIELSTDVEITFDQRFRVIDVDD